MNLDQVDSEVKVPEASGADKTRYCNACGGILLRYRVIRQEKSCTYLKIKLCCSKDKQFDSFEIAIQH